MTVGRAAILCASEARDGRCDVAASLSMHALGMPRLTMHWYRILVDRPLNEEGGESERVRLNGAWQRSFEWSTMRGVGHAS